VLGVAAGLLVAMLTAPGTRSTAAPRSSGRGRPR
jgi:hypothetical protein